MARKHGGASGKQGHHTTKLHAKGMHRKSPSAVEPHPKGPSVNHHGGHKGHRGKKHNPY